MANGNPSLGEAVSLQYRMPSGDMAISQIRQMKAQEAAEAAARKKQALKEYDEAKKYDIDLDKWNISQQSGIPPVYQTVLRGMSEDLMKTVREVRDKGGNPVSNPEVRRQKEKIMNFASDAKSSGDRFLKEADKGFAAPDDYEINEELTKIFNDPDRYNEWVELNQGNVYMGGVISAKDKTNYAEYFTKRGSAIKVPEVTTPQGKSDVTIKRFTPKELDIKWEEEKQLSPQQYKKMYAQLTSDGRMSDEQAEATMKSNFIRGIENIYREKERKKGKGGAGKDSELSIEDIQKNVPMRITEGETGKQVDTYARYGLTLPSNIAMTIPANKNVLEVGTGKRLEWTGQMYITGAKLISKKVKEKGKIRFEPYLLSSATLTKSDGTSVKSDVAVPLSDVRGHKDLQKYDEVLTEFERLVSDLNEGDKKKSGTGTVPTATRAEWKQSGWSDAQINEAVKLGKIKVK